MDNSSIRLSFQCPKKWETMEPTNGGRFCDDCKKTVTDFSNVPLPNLHSYVPANNKDQSCGNFRAFQLDKPFGNWRDKIIATYQSVSLKWTLNNPSRQLTLLFITIALITTGCHRNLRGKFRTDNNCKKKKHNQSEQTISEPIEKK